jgi:hypothetical protein
VENAAKPGADAILACGHCYRCGDRDLRPIEPALPASLVLILLAAACVFAVLLDQVKVAVFRLLPVD